MDRNSNKNRSLLICLTLILITLAVFWQVCTCDFVYFDDPDYVYENPNIQAGITPGAIKWAFTTGHAANWHPLTWLSHMLDWRLFGSNPAGHHLVNLIFHIANTLLLFIVLKQMTGAIWSSAFVAALFALHPLHVESVAWVSERKDVLSTFFWLLTMWAYVRFVRRPRVAGYLLVVVFFALGLMSKPMLVTLPFVLLLLDYWPLDRLSLNHEKAGTKHSLSHLLIEKIPLFAMVLASCIVTFIAQKKGGVMRTAEACSIPVRLANTFISYLQYITMMIWPARLAVLYPHPYEKVSVLFAVISAVLLLAVTILILRFNKNRRYLVTGWFWYLGTLVPVIGLVQVGNQALADRYSYITLTGLFIIIAWGMPDLLARWRYKKIALAMSALLIILAISICTHFQLRYWQNSLTLLQRALDVTKDNCIAHGKVAELLHKQGKLDEAIYHYSEAIRIKPRLVVPLNGLGLALYEAGRVDEAINYYKRALEIDPGFAPAHANLGYALVAKGKFDEAVGHYRIALTTTDTIPMHNTLGYALLKLGRFEEAVTEYRKVLSAMPNDPNILNELGYALAHSGKFDEAISLCNKALQIAPDFVELRISLGFALAQSGKLEEAVKEYEKVLNIAPQNVIAHNSLGTLFSQQGKPDEAAAEYRKSLQIKPGDSNVLYALGVVLSRQGKTDEAVKYFAEAIRIKPDFAAAHDNIGRAMALQGKIDEAIEHFEWALKIKPDWVEPMNNIAWFLAASEKTTAHNPDKAVRLARRACELTNFKRPDLLDTLAVAYAAAGNFSKAIETAEKALELCRSPKQNTLKEEIENRLVLYKAGKPYIDAR